MVYSEECTPTSTEGRAVPKAAWRVFSVLSGGDFRESMTMAKKTEQTKIADEPQLQDSTVFSDLTRELGSAFAASSQKFLDRLQFLRQELGVQFESCEDENGQKHFFWAPHEGFNWSAFVISARQTYEAWNAARHVNSELGLFEGKTIATLAWQFDQLFRGIDVQCELFDGIRDFEQAVGRFGLLLQVKNNPPKVVTTQRATRGRKNAIRDAQWHDWRQIDGLTDAQIRDRWDRENPHDPVSRNNIENGLGIVASAISGEKKRRIQGTS